ncbi:malonyl CoA-acyl carrier protein transacylase [Pantoea alhagi]|uniref:ACP S-malonyltransferase n=1 Tax=Mixta sp. BE291 TaxID=3158787 RepID=UPI002863AA3C|nr:malonyl CoA-acyl carrier protein transacylase [Pantoea alhagi]
MHAFVFPGQGSQRKGMGEALFRKYSEKTQQANQILGYALEDICLASDTEKLDFTLYSQPAIYIVNALSYLDSLEQGMPIPDFFAGHSLGEFNALQAAGAFDFVTGLKLVKKRAELMSELTGGSMAAVVGLTLKEIESVLMEKGFENIGVANYNTATQVVVSGPENEITLLNNRLKKEPSLTLFHVLKTSGAFHSKYMGRAEIEFAQFIEGFDFNVLARPVISNVTAREFSSDMIKILLPRQITSQVLWYDSVQYMRSKGVEKYHEASGSHILTNMITNIYEKSAPVKRASPEPVAVTSPPQKKNEPACSILLNLAGNNHILHEDRVIQSFWENDAWYTVTTQDLTKKIEKLGQRLADIIPAQQRAVIFLPQCAGYTQALFSCWYANVIAVPTPVTDSSQIQQRYKQLESIVRDSQCQYFITNDDFEQAIKPLARSYAIKTINIDRLLAQQWEGADAAPRALQSPLDSAMLLYTSGSTADPKGVVISHQGLFHAATSPLWGYTRDSRVLSWLPQHHAFGLLYSIMAPLAQGSAAFILPTERFISEPEIWFQLIDKVKATHSGVAGFAFEYMLQQADADTVSGYDLSSLLSLSCAGDIISHSAYCAFYHKFSATGLKKEILSPNYGMSEAAPLTQKPQNEAFRSVSIAPVNSSEQGAITLSSADNSKIIISCGVAAPDTHIMIVEPEKGALCPPLTPGEIWVKTPCQGAGYFNHPVESEEIFANCHPVSGEKGYLRTGDWGFMQDGHLYVIGRLKETLVVNGKKYHPKDLEILLGENIAACALPRTIFAAEKNDETIIVVVQEIKEDEHEGFYQGVASDIVSVLSHHVSLRVDDIIFIPPGGLPVTGSRKVQRGRVREKYYLEQLEVVWRREKNDLSSSGSKAISDTEMQEILRAIIQQEAKCASKNLAPETDFSSLGLDSIASIRIAGKIKQTFNIPSFKTGVLFTCRNMLQLMDYISSHAPTRQPRHHSARYATYRDSTVLRYIRSYQEQKLSLNYLIEKIKEGV